MRNGANTIGRRRNTTVVGTRGTREPTGSVGRRGDILPRGDMKRGDTMKGEGKIRKEMPHPHQQAVIHQVLQYTLFMLLFLVINPQLYMYYELAMVHFII